MPDRSHHSRPPRYKRIMDLALVVTTAPLTLPLAVSAAVVTLVTQGRPILFRQARLGLRGEPFEVLKFRTMAPPGSVEGRQSSEAERLNPAGRWLRKLSLDELPQLVNVAIGDMSLVGPRPLHVAYKPFYSQRENLRHSVRPGITGLAQISGRNDVSWDDRLELDAKYAETMSFREDLRIIGLTAMKIIRGNNVSAVPGDSMERLDDHRSYPSTPSFQLQRFGVEDISLRVTLFNDPNIRSVLSLSGDIDESSTREWLISSRRDSSRKDFALKAKASGATVAILGFRAQDPDDLPELYIVVVPEHQGIGIGPTALRLMFEWMRRNTAHRGVALKVTPANLAAVSMYERLGFIQSPARSTPSKLYMYTSWDSYPYERSSH